jgi:uncharacterized protein
MKIEHVDHLYTQHIGSRMIKEWIEIFEHYLLSVDAQFDPGHRLDHVRRVAALAITFAMAEDADLDVIIPAVWLHDTVPISKFSEQRKNSSLISATFSLQFLAEKGYPTAKFPQIKHAIEAHSFSGGIKPITLEAQIVQDADRLDALGAIGIARTLMVGGENKNHLYHADEPFPQLREPDDRKYTVDHFFVKLLRLQDTLHTSSARAEGLHRTNVMREFLRQLAREIGANQEGLS